MSEEAMERNRMRDSHGESAVEKIRKFQEKESRKVSEADRKR